MLQRVKEKGHTIYDTHYRPARAYNSNFRTQSVEKTFLVLPMGGAACGAGEPSVDRLRDTARRSGNVRGRRGAATSQSAVVAIT
ncbi:unnamed protein product, partial [Iphiclides podalirius]